MHTLDVRLHVGQGTHRGPLTVFPVWTAAPSVAPGYLTGANAAVDVEARAGSPAVDQLIVTNRGDHPVLLLAGELLEGGMQHRADRLDAAGPGPADRAAGRLRRGGPL